MNALFVRPSLLIASFLGLATGALHGSPTADYRFVPVKIPPVGTLILLVEPNAQRTLPPAGSGEAVTVGSSLGSAAAQAAKSLSMPADLPRFDSSPIRASVPIFPAPLPPLLRPISRPN